MKRVIRASVGGKNFNAKLNDVKDKLNDLVLYVNANFDNDDILLVDNLVGEGFIEEANDAAYEITEYLHGEGYL